MYDLHRLRLLRELKHRGTLAAVAAAHSYSPSSVSQQLSLLERETGVQLLERVGRRVRLTAQAEILVGHAEAVLERLERARADIAASLTELAGTVRIATFQTAALSLLPGALTALRAAHPRLRVHVSQLEPEDALPALVARDVDLALTEEYPGRPRPRPAGVEMDELCEDRLRLACARPGTGLRPAGPLSALRDRADSPWVMEPAGTAARDWAVALCREAGFEPDVRFESPDLLLQLRLVERGHAVAFLPDLVWGTGSASVGLYELPPGRRARKLFTAVREGSSRHPAVLACRAALVRAVQGTAEQPEAGAGQPDGTGER
ncbi:LysR substrate-binding domain-containing protein [Streptomyces boncukensis]|uniref:LysR family transcriptional regulator n=1 Tax=Streptomyces boncukensis TaxID=2711219 RepID=A0A6G4X833_9ACTN|nr:LysR substrate-binding domain-containing protein [Streptomyces boncukensis]NGO73302.1 LysR family transcriptional regulator [Streptomyces boncukensis]